MLNADRAQLGIGSSATEEAPWSPQGKLASNVGSQPTRLPGLTTRRELGLDEGFPSTPPMIALTLG
jgi:hypothetical protein